MTFANALIQAYNTKWAFVNSFSVNIEFANTPKMVLKKHIKWTDADDELLNLSVISINTPNFTNQNIESFVGNRWNMHNGRDELYRFEVTFRDVNQMYLYKKFIRMYQKSRDIYFDEAKVMIRINKDPDYFNESEVKVWEFDETMIDSVSQIQFNTTTEAQIAEFTVGFKTRSPILK
jgi:hypothetical protein